jgi:hypothetical protein
MCQASFWLSSISGLFSSVHAVMLRMSVRPKPFLSAVFRFEAQMPICLYFIGSGVDRGAELQVAEFVLVLLPVILAKILQYLDLYTIFHFFFLNFVLIFRVFFLISYKFVVQILNQEAVSCKDVIYIPIPLPLPKIICCKFCICIQKLHFGFINF